MLTEQVLHEQIAQRLYQELGALAGYAAKPLMPTITDSATVDTSPDHLQRHLLALALANAVLMNSPALFGAHVRQMSQQLGPETTAAQVAALGQALLPRLSTDEYALAARMLNAGRNALTAPESTDAAPLPAPDGAPAGRFGTLAINYLALLLAADRPAAQRLVLQEAEASTDVRDLYLHVLQPAQREVGSLWQRGTISIAEEHYCTAATAGLMAQLRPYFQRTPRNGRRLLATCVAGDPHTIGLQMVVDFLEYDGWDVSYLGASRPLNSIHGMVADQRVDLVLMAASMPHHVPQVRDLVAALRRDPATRCVRVLVGGHSFGHDATLWQNTDADAWAASDAEAVAVTRGLFE
ncbi:cobalamin B12-binding domain-containing protein [Hymenobacter sp. BT664]|uniref:Cobalamin B12-binding domain-containing protein n=1 Tax=Hymenobacter montanus TaxID=2771359 RepID=A0A927GIN2_9BACT|nr:cobalamin-dependent protein [Hymenobacter montanus]MBD2767592.1 cobalamin B12-binding domain-containing protein [Hymenobacter montanus]